MKKKIFEAILIILICWFNGCLKDAVVSPSKINFNSNAELLNYLESTGNYINSEKFPSLVDAQEVYNNPGSYLIIDVRSKEDFAVGHIQDAINVVPDSILILMKSIQTENYSKIVIVSSTGQSASYYCCLLNLDGFSNVYAMKYGMAAWNNAFSAPWLNALRNGRSLFLTSEIFTRAGYSKLPSQVYPNPNANIKSKLEFRITQLLSIGFEDDIKDSYNTPVTNFFKFLPGNDTLYNYLICLGIPAFYTSHPYFAVDYRYYPPYLEFETARYLQTIPGNKPVYLYSYAGQVSAEFTAYLKVLGYDAYSILYGGNNLIYSTMHYSPELSQYAFDSNDINDFPFVTGK